MFVIIVKQKNVQRQQPRSTPFFSQLDARAGIRTRVGGMKTHYDGPSYTTRATACPPTTR